MKTKLTIVFLLIFICHLGAQNLLKSLYDLELFPEDMKYQREFIDESISDMLIYNFIYGGPGNAQFDIKSKNGLKINFPFKDDFWLTFTDNKTNQASTMYTIHYTYDFKYPEYSYDAEITDSTFSLPTIFNLAVKHYDYDGYELISKILNNYKTEINYEDKRIEFFNQLADVLVEDKIDFNSLLNEEEIEYLIPNEIVEIMWDAILDETNYEFEEISSKVFEHFILVKSDETKTRENISRIFYEDNIVQTIEENVLQPYVHVSLLKGGLLHLPEKYVNIDNQYNSNLLLIDIIDIRVDFKNHELVIIFESKFPNNIIIQKAEYKNAIPENINLRSKKLKLKITNTDYKLEFFEHNPYKRIETEAYKVLIE